LWGRSGGVAEAAVANRKTKKYWETILLQMALDARKEGDLVTSELLVAHAFSDSADGSCLASSAVREPPTAYRPEPATTLGSERAVKSATLRRASALENTFSAFASAGATTWLTNDDPGIGVSVPSSMVRAARKISAAVIRRASRASLYPPCHPRTPFIEDKWPSASFGSTRRLHAYRNVWPS
jgi:hypothetical protein